MKLDDYDRQILRALQENSDLSVADLADRINLSQTPCWRRLKRLKEERVITKNVALLNPKKVQLGVTVYVYLTMSAHDERSLTAFESAVQQTANVVECYSTSGNTDYILRVVVDNVEQYERLLKSKLVHLPNIASINSTFALKQIKYTTQLPL